MRRVLLVAMVLAIVAPAASVPSQARSSGEITVISNLMAAKYEACRQEAKRQHLHLWAWHRFLKACHAKP